MAETGGGWRETGWLRSLCPQDPRRERLSAESKAARDGWYWRVHSRTLSTPTPPQRDTLEVSISGTWKLRSQQVSCLLSSSIFPQLTGSGRRGARSQGAHCLGGAGFTLTRQSWEPAAGTGKGFWRIQSSARRSELPRAGRLAPQSWQPSSPELAALRGL